MRILPAILTDDPADLEHKIRQAESFTDWVQIDIMDGRFVPSHSIEASHLAQVKTPLNLEVHLMVQEPESWVEAFARAGARKIVFHYEAAPNPDKMIRRVRELGLSVGLALNPETPVSAITGFTDKVDCVLFLSVHPGFYGKEFLPEVLDKVREFRATGSKLEVGLDGGIKTTNLTVIKAAGVDYACVGSAIFNHVAPRQSYKAMLELIKDG